MINININVFIDFEIIIFLGFLNNETINFMTQLWKLLISAQSSPNGIVRIINIFYIFLIFEFFYFLFYF